jgi:hypothetical protein
MEMSKGHCSGFTEAVADDHEVVIADGVIEIEEAPILIDLVPSGIEITKEEINGIC